MRTIGLLPFLLLLLGCEPSQKNIAVKKGTYFSLKTYFENEATRLSKHKLSVDKIVSINGVSERKELNINDWNKELAVFIQADINKKAWKGAFNTATKQDTTYYTTEDEKIAVKKVIIVEKNHKVKELRAYLTTKNVLYESKDTLVYYVDSLYYIKKNQHIRFLNPKEYLIIGKLLK